MASTRRSTSASRATTKLPSFPSQKPPPRSRSSAGALRRSSSATLPSRDGGEVSGRVRVAIRLRPRNTEELVADADFADCVELQPEVKRLKLRKNNWDSDTYEFDEVLTESASQKRVYEVVTKPVIESVLNGYNGTVMAYGQTGTGKTFTLASLGEEDMAARGIMVRSMEDILADISPETDTVSVSYLQIYMETIQDLLHTGNENIVLVEDHKTGDVSVSGATVVEIKDQNSFLELLRLGEAHRRVANTKMNTESSRSHAILMVHMRRSIKESHESPIYDSCENGTAALLVKSCRSPTVRKSKLVIVDLAGSERMDKSGSEGRQAEEAKFINLSLSALGKCINALAENSSHVPIRDSKLTRLLRDSFGGTARTSLIVTIGPSPRHRAETTSTIMFGQRAMKVENMVKLKEEFDYKTLCRRLHIELDKLIADNERQRKNYDDDVQRLANDVQRIKEDAQMCIAEAERGYHIALENERIMCEKDYIDSIKKLEARWMEKQETIQKTANENASSCASESEELSQIKELLKNETISRQSSEEEIIVLKNQILLLEKSKTALNDEVLKLRKKLEDEASQREKLEEEISRLTSQLLQLSFEADETRRYLDNGDPKGFSGLDSFKQSHLRESEDGRKGSFSRLFEQAGLQKLLSLLESEDTDTQVHAVKVVANLAAEEANQEKIVEAGGLTYLLTLLRGSKDETIRRVAAGAIANLAMNAKNQELIMDDGGTTLLASTAANAEDPQTLRMVAGAIANLCGNDKLQSKLSEEGGIKALLGMVRCSHPEVLAQVARGIANFAKCESKASSQGTKLGRSLLIGDGALPWLVRNASSESPPIRRHIELALCHLAQNEANAKEMIDEGACLELTRISRDCSRQDIRTLANRTLTSNSIFLTELKRLQYDH